MAKSTTCVNLAALFFDSGMPGIVCDLNHSQRDSTKFRESLPGLEFTDRVVEQAPENGFVLVDTSADFEGDIVDAVLLSDLIVIPCMTNVEGAESSLRIWENITEARKSKPELDAAILITGAAPRGEIGGFTRAMRVYCEGHRFTAEIPANASAVGEAASLRQPLVRLKPRNPVSLAYRQLATEIKGRLSNAE